MWGSRLSYAVLGRWQINESFWKDNLTECYKIFKVHTILRNNSSSETLSEGSIIHVNKNVHTIIFIMLVPLIAKGEKATVIG